MEFMAWVVGWIVHLPANWAREHAIAKKGILMERERKANLGLNKKKCSD